VIRVLKSKEDAHKYYQVEYIKAKGLDMPIIILTKKKGLSSK